MSNNGQPHKTKFLPLWSAFSLALGVWEVLPWVISLLLPHYGWKTGHPGIWNLPGLVLVLAGTAGLFWGLALHSMKSSAGIAWDLDKSYLLMRGPYAYSRHPMYLSELILLFGWVIFFGSVAVLITFVAWCMFFHRQAPIEEQVMEAHFGEAYREYKKRVPRWLGKVTD